MPLWSKAQRTSAEESASVTFEDDAVPEADDAVPEADSDALYTWLEELGSFAGPDTLLHFKPAPGGTIDLTHAHPSGLAQLLAGRRTRLSTLIRDQDQYAAAMDAARRLRSKIHELSSERGIDVGYLAAGTASWRSPFAGVAEQLSAPVLLTPVTVSMRSGQDDYELQVTGQARLNPSLVRFLKAEYDVGLDVPTMEGMAYGTARFDPHPVLDRLRSATAGINGMQVSHHLLASTFADLEEHIYDGAISSAHPVIGALLEDSVSGQVQPFQAIAADLPPIDERDPEDELLLKDADSTQQEVLDLIGSGASLAVEAPPGTGQTQTALNSLAALTAAGKRVLVVAERRATLNQLVNQLDELQLGTLVLQLHAGVDSAELKDKLVRAIMRNERSAEPQLGHLHQTLVENRHALQDHVRSLHNVRQRWGCSPYQAMQSLAKLTALQHPPATTVRLKRSVLDNITDRAELAHRLRRAAELGGFSKARWQSPWYGARLVNRKETEEAHALAVELARELPQLREKMDEVAGYSQISIGESVAEWGRQLDLLVAIRGSLDKFTPDIFDRPVTDLISATAPASWRRAHKVDMTSMTRSRLRRVAKEYIRPGVHISDLHGSLLEVQQQHTAWSEYATSQRHPSIPSGLADVHNFHHQVEQKLEKLSAVLVEAKAGGGLSGISHQAALERLQALAEDRQTLVSLPERTLLLENMREHGLSELLDDLAEREVGTEEVGAELELAWWQSALEAMISGDDYLAMSDGESLRRLEADYRLADNAHISSGASRLRWELSRRWRDGVASHAAEAHSLRQLIKDGTPGLGALSGESPLLVQALLPVFTASPLMVPSLLDSGHEFDAVVILDAEATSLQSVLPSIGRAAQVIAFGDPQLGAARPFSVGIESDSAQDDDGPQLTSAMSALSRILPQRSLSVVYRCVDATLAQHLSTNFYDGKLIRLPAGHAAAGARRSFAVEYLPDGTGMPTSGQDAVESVVAEVNRVVDLVFDHARNRPGQSLAVITASGRHAGRVAEAVGMQLPNYPDAAEFFSSGPEPFRVVPLERAAGLVRDSVIFSLGFGRTPHGRALHSFGSLSGPAGSGKFVVAMTRARSSLHVLTCFKPDDLDPTRLTHGASDFYDLINRELGGGTAPSAGTVSSGDLLAAAGTDSDGGIVDDPLVTDLVGRLQERGARVWRNYDGEIDVVAAADPFEVPAPATPGQQLELPAPVAVESDGTEKYRRMSVRERSRLRPQMLEAMGWRHVSLWTIEVFTDPVSCTDLVGGYLGLDDRSDVQSNDEGTAAAPGQTLPAGEGASTGAPLLPNKAAEDEDISWGDRDEQDRDEWLREQQPPHWN
ncbi:DUF4011 domain-containing protein [Arthrobacter castelli]|uniref:DUF4011 domain-containing protein n=1 Tax=Arthrobacter castelli TaxID=271431 RepID=UPI00047DF3DD|nr:DUF4011 domain-containing protein [Arthrobacter castelli]